MSNPDPSTNDFSAVRNGTCVVIELETETGMERLAFDIMPDDQADFARGFLGQGTLLARAILGQPIGKVIPYKVGDAISIKVISIAASEKIPPQDVVARRREAIRKAVEQAERTNAMIFASSFSGKWGDYDPAGIEHWEQPGETQVDEGKKNG